MCSLNSLHYYWYQGYRCLEQEGLGTPLTTKPDVRSFWAGPLGPGGTWGCPFAETVVGRGQSGAGEAASSGNPRRAWGSFPPGRVMAR